MQNSSSKIIANGVLWTTLVNLVKGVYGFVSVPLLISYFGKSDYGLIGLALSINVYLRLMDLGLNSTNIRFFSTWLAQKKLDKVEKLFQTSLVFYGSIGFLNAFILFVISFFSEQIFHLNIEQDQILKHLLYILAISAIISWFSSCFDQLVKAYEHVGWVQKVSILPKLSQIIILGLTIMLGFSIELYYSLTTFSMFIVLPFLIFKIKKLAPYITFYPSFNLPILKEILPYCLNIFSFGIFQFSMNSLRPVFLGMRCDIDSVAEYGVLSGIVSSVMLLGGAFISVILPTATKAVAVGDNSAQEKIAYDGTRYISILLCFFCFGIISISEQLITVYVGSDYLNLAIWLNFWLLLTLSSHNQAISSLILSRSNIKVISIISMISSVAGLLSCWILLPLFDVGATVISYGIYLFIQLSFYYFYYWPKVMHLDSSRIFFKSFFPFLLAGFVSAFFSRLLTIDSNVWLHLILKGLLFFVCYLVFVCFFLKKNDYIFVRSIISRK